MKVIALIAALMTGALLIYGTEEMPDWGDPNSPASSHVSPKYIQEALEKTATPNIVTAVLADYRSYDTMGETVVVFTAGIGCILMLRKKRKGEGD
ncbi:MAG: hydrogen gas-evolving membrane-bound hydrogenase subunit E [Desulfobacterales bacterium]